MIGGRRGIESPRFLDFSGLPVPPLKFFLQREYSPAGVTERPSPSIVLSHTPWWTEIAVELTGVDAIAILYVLPQDETNRLLAACLDQTFEPFFDLLSGDDFGDAVAQLTEQHWPDVYAMLRRSNELAATGRTLCNVITPGRVQWVVADQLLDPGQDEISNEQLLDLIGASAQTLLRAANFAALPGLVAVTGGPHRLTQRLERLATLVAAAAAIGGVLQGNPDIQGLLALGEAAEDAIDGMFAKRRTA